MTLTPTPEQTAIINGFRTGQDLVIEAGAGSGKTSTLRMLAAAGLDRTGVYLAYNRAIADDAKNSFPGNVTCKTAHGFAYAAVIGRDRRWRTRLDAPRMRAAETARLLRINSPLNLGVEGRAPLAPQQLARLVMETVARFCRSADDRIGRWHVPTVNGLDEPAHRDALARYLVPIAQRAWDTDLTTAEGKLRFDHSIYLKMWALTRPTLVKKGGFVLLDEAQDANPVIARVVEDQRVQKILVGDRNQAINGWNGAVDAMQKFSGLRFQLSQSFRFGPAVAAEANKWLEILGAQLRLTGFEQIPSVVGTAERPDAILCRSNGGAMSRVLQALAAGRRVALVGGGEGIERMARAAQDLKAGRPTDHPELCAFTTWAEVQDYVDNDAAGSDLKVFVKLVDRHDPDEIISACRRLVDERRADVVVSTAHKAKGREWHSVLVAGDFQEPKPNDDGSTQVSREDAMLAYVTVTRAKRLLDRAGLSWVDSLTPCE